MPPRIYTTRNSFNAGEVSELVGFRDDVSKYSSACLTCENAVPLVEGGAKKMPGSYFAGATALGGAMFTASIAATTLTVTQMTSGFIRLGQTLIGSGIAEGTIVTAFGTGLGGVGTYTVNNSQTVSSEIMQIVASGKSRLVPFQFSTIQGAVLEFSEGIVRIWDAATEGDWSLSLVLKTPSNAGGSFTYSISGDTATVTATGTTANNQSTNGGFPVVAVGGSLTCTVPVSATCSIGSGVNGGGGGVAKFSYSPDNEVTWIQYTEIDLSSNQTVSFNSGFSTSAVTSLDQLKFKVFVSAGSGGMTPPTITFTGTYGSPVVTYVSSTASNYNPATAYVFGNIALVGPFAFTAFSGGTPGGTLYIASPYGTTNANTVPITFSVNASDALNVTVTGASPNQRINIALANATASLNAASAIQAAIRALVSLNTPLGNFIDLSQWTVTPDPLYFALPWITAPPQAQWVNKSFSAGCIVPNQFNQFPVLTSGGFNATYWEDATLLDQALELVTPYKEEDLFALDCSTQSADVLWIFHPKYPPAVIERLGANSWQYSLSLPGQQPGEPPYRGTLDVVKTGFSALGQSITNITQGNPCMVSVSATTKVFAAGQRIYLNLIAGMVELNQGEFLVTNTYTLSGGIFTFGLLDTNGNSIDSTGYLKYESGGFAVAVNPLFAAPGDYPACGTLYQERLCVGGSFNNPTQMNGSVQDDYPDFIADPNAADYAIQFTLVSNKLDQILNIIGTPNALVIGTAGGVWVMAGTNGSSLSQTNVIAAKQTSQGVGALQPQLVNSSAIFVSRSSRIVLFLTFNFATNQWDNYDLTRLNRQITLGPTEDTSGVAQTGFQMEPYPIFWSVRNDGQLIGLVFNTQDQVYAWFRVNMAPGLVESVAVVSGSNQEDQIAIVVKRTINGITQRYVEYFMPQEIFSELSNAYFVNGGQRLQLLPSVNITGITNANPPVVIAPLHGFSNGMSVQIQNVIGMAAPSPSTQTINQDSTEAYTIAGVTDDTFQLVGMDTTTWTPYAGGGTVKQVTNQITGLSYLLGQQVVAVGDGAVILQPTTVTADTISFPYYANLITIGIPYTYTLQPTNPTLSSQGATTRGMRQKLSRVTLSLYQAMNGKMGIDLDHMYDITYGPGTQAQTPQMSTGEYTRDLDADWDDESTLYIQQSDPLPFTVRGLVARMSANQD
jgi:hypothetical protein